MKTFRNYSGSDVAMLTACAVIVDNAITDQDFLTTKRPGWKTPFFENLKLKIDSGFEAVGIDKAGELRRATNTMTVLQMETIDRLSEIKLQISEDFKSDKIRQTEILNTLGFTSFYTSTVKKNQTSLLKLLNQFKENLTDDVRMDIEVKGIAPESLDKIVACADEMKTANVAQEVLKGSRQNLTEIDLNLLNDIYYTVISVAKIAYKFYKGNSSKQAQYSYTKILSRLTAGGTRKQQEISTEV